MIAESLLSAYETRLEIRARAEDPALPGNDDALDSVVDVEEGEGIFQLGHHCCCEGIVVFGPVEFDYYDGGGRWGGGGDMVAADLGVGCFGVGGWEGQLLGVG